MSGRFVTRVRTRLRGKAGKLSSKSRLDYFVRQEYQDEGEGEGQGRDKGKGKEQDSKTKARQKQGKTKAGVEVRVIIQEALILEFTSHLMSHHLNVFK